MEAAQALADLTEISSQIEAAVLFSEDGSVAGSTLADEARAQALARGALEILAAAGDGTVTQVEASTREGSVFVVRDGSRGILALTSTDPTVGLVFYDLKSCLRNADEKPKRRRKPAGKDDDA
jgi:predicted regulator of Ras-like GTPase activity (Roadblock/LC7/MglB family)